ncbi:Telomere length regulator protein rif1 [Fulvia fulva]|uniref:Telomere length regulator protein rif1 n=1 Tax=Passalora fulva TaxID=5499 RepID=A0A9Q8L6Y5_PASFU|nr:Telomere length regulator protein rif1 [Fulvia fulva]KAK4635060.1 Telomere length regulator protein rif1 [Fulvia fulva]KAK4638367.1 Telomere length regulator protein rif1 [Fulvia fulva]UJO11348.1 Telomere length regulator protein rif1 [Fulvia fulva]WPV09941.1 Telomere length regulator protein rif1 [Fulvia fulva]WPV23220.1 Telomere length regulator protein rif1 [Fulvia fulva]
MFSSPSAPSKYFASLPARPPTPPKDISNDVDVDDALRFLEQGHHETALITNPSKPTSIKTSQTTPSSGTPALAQSRGASANKKVDFSPCLTYHQPAQPTLQGPLQGRSPRHRLSAQAVKPLKSILKASNENLPLTPDDLEHTSSYFSPQEPGSFRKMMQSVVQQLAGSSRDGRRDAYLAINGALKAYEGVPDPQAMVDKMPMLQQFISRDMVWKDQNGKLDSSIVSQALNLTCAILHHPRTSPALDDDFRTFVVDRSIAALEQPEVPKAIIKIHAYLLSQQRFGSHIVTAARADRLVTALQSIEDRCSGNSIISARLIAYQRLIEAQPNVMLKRMRDWIEHIFHGMLSSINDTRARGIETCTHAGLYFGSQPQAATIMYELCEKSVDSQDECEEEQEQTYGDYLTERLNHMALDKELATYAPQIWGAVILLFRNKKRPVEKWPKFKQWLQTIQRCLNSGDIEVKQQANIAWSKLVFAVMPDASTDPALRSMLRVPIVAGLEKRGSDKLSQQQRQIAMDSYCNLLHYGLRPTVSYEEIDKAWELYVEPVLSNMGKGNSKVQVGVCRILEGLLKKSDGVWNANAANLSESIKPEELPRLDAKWVRSRVGKVLGVLEPILQSTMCSSPDRSRYMNSCWKLLLQAVAEAGTQEVKTSSELKEAIAQFTNLFRRLWHASAGSAKSTDGSVWIQRYEALLETAVDNLGAAHFVEDILAKTSANDVEAAPTPSHRMSKHSRVAHPPFVFLFALYYRPTNTLQVDDIYTKSAAWFLELLADTKGTVSGTLGLLHRSLQFCSDQAEPTEICASLWPAIATASVSALGSRKTTSPQHDAQIMGVALKSSLNILSYGLKYTHASPARLDNVRDMYQATCQAAKHYGRDGGVALGVMEPFAKIVKDMAKDIESGVLSQVTVSILDNGVWPKSRQELEHDRKALWAISLDPPRSATFDPFEHVYAAAIIGVQRGYDCMNIPSQSQPTGLLQAVTAFVERCPRSMLLVALRRLQAGIATWVQDKRREVFPRTSNSKAAPSAAHVTQLWTQWMLLLEQLPRKDTSALQALEVLMVAGFSSPSRDVVNKTITVWNATFGSQQSLDYPRSLRSVLRARKAQVEIELPQFPEDDSEEETVELPDFVETQQGLSSFETGLDAAFKSTPRFAFGNKPRSEHVPVKNSPAPVAQSSNVGNRRSRLSTTPKVRLRHDDSQIDFAPIDNTLPSLTREESQFLTDHQKEVKARQHGDAQMFPDLSSSPMSKSTAKGKNIAKKLDFAPQPSIEQEEDTTFATPTGLVDGNPMSDDMPSSPTPKASDNITRADERACESDEDDNETIVDPPSSPPREDEDTIAAALEQPEDTGGPPAELDETILATELPGQQPVTEDAIEHGEDQDEAGENGISDLPSDTVLPAEQLEREAEAAAMEAQLLDNAEDTTIVDTEEILDNTVVEVSAAEDPKQQVGTPSRIENSMLEPQSQQSAKSGAHENLDAPSSRKGSKKRKRNFETTHTSKKKSKSSPFKSFFSRLTGSSQENDDDVQDEIVVASSRSPNKIVSPKVVVPTGKIRHPGALEVVDDVVEDSQEPEPSKAAPPVKRKRGRPPKMASQPQAISQSQELPSTRSDPAVEHRRGRKRRASLSSMGTTDEQGSTSFVADTPAPFKSRKSTRLSQEGSQVINTSRRPSVFSVKRAKRVEEDEQEGDDSEDDLSSAAQSTSAHGRETVESKSILERLRGVYADFKGKVFGSRDEERQFDDLLFEFRREVHEAGRRGYAKDE